MSGVHFRINYQVLQKRKFEQFIQKFAREIDVPLENLLIERYQKIPEQFQAEFRVELNNESSSDVVYQMLIWANCLSPRGWSINGPHVDNNLVFECIYSDNDGANPLKWAHLEFEN